MLASGMLEDVERAARLYGMVKDPDLEIALGSLSREDKMTICAHGLMEKGEWEKAGRILTRLDPIERERERRKRQSQFRPVPPPEVQPEPQPQPEPAPKPRAFRWSQAAMTDVIDRHPGLAEMSNDEITAILLRNPPDT
jgi:hypothetical protein